MILSGKSDELAASLEKRMNEHAERLEFELAGFVVEQMHSDQPANGCEQGAGGQQRFFGDAAHIAPRLVLVNAHQEK